MARAKKIMEATTAPLDAMLARLQLSGIRDQLDSLRDEAARANLSARGTLILLCEREIARTMDYVCFASACTRLTSQSSFAIATLGLAVGSRRCARHLSSPALLRLRAKVCSLFQANESDICWSYIERSFGASCCQKNSGVRERNRSNAATAALLMEPTNI